MAINYDAPIEIRDARNGSWFWIHTHVWRDKRLSMLDKMVYGTIASYVNNGQSAFPSTAKISVDCERSKRHIYRSLKNLEKHKYLSIERISGKPNIYTLLKTIPVTPMSLPSDTHVTTTSDTTAPLTISNITISNNYIPLSKKAGSVGCPLGKEKHFLCIDFLNRLAKMKNLPTTWINFSKQVSFLHKLLRVGYTFDVIREIAVELDKDTFMWDKWDIGTIASRIERKGREIIHGIK